MCRLRSSTPSWWGRTVGEIVQSRDPQFKPGTKVLTPLGWQLYGVAKASDLTSIDTTSIPAPYYLGVVGMPGMTAWFGSNEIGKPKSGETLVVSAASGAVGSVVGQLAKIAGCRVVGIAGGAAKCDYVTRELGFDACVDYKLGHLFDDLRAACPPVSTYASKTWARDSRHNVATDESVSRALSFVD